MEKHIHVRIPQGLKQKFDQKCKREGRTPSKVIRTWIEEYTLETTEEINSYLEAREKGMKTIKVNSAEELMQSIVDYPKALIEVCSDLDFRGLDLKGLVEKNRDKIITEMVLGREVPVFSGVLDGGNHKFYKYEGDAVIFYGRSSFISNIIWQDC